MAYHLRSTSIFLGTTTQNHHYFVWLFLYVISEPWLVHVQIRSYPLSTTATILLRNYTHFPLPTCVPWLQQIHMITLLHIIHTCKCDNHKAAITRTARTYCTHNEPRIECQIFRLFAVPKYSRTRFVNWILLNGIANVVYDLILGLFPRNLLRTVPLTSPTKPLIKGTINGVVSFYQKHHRFNYICVNNTRNWKLYTLGRVVKYAIWKRNSNNYGSSGFLVD